MRDKHPVRNPLSSPIVQPDHDQVTAELSLDDVKNFIRSFQPGSAGGPDGLRPPGLSNPEKSRDRDSGSGSIPKKVGIGIRDRDRNLGIVGIFGISCVGIGQLVC